MVKHRFAFAQALVLGFFLSCCTLNAFAQSSTRGQEDSEKSNATKKVSTSNALEHKIRPGAQRVTMYVNSSKILTLEGKQIPRALVNNPELVNAIAISSNQIQLSGLKAGVTQINLWDDDSELYSIDVIVYGDAKELELLLETEFPNASLRVRPLSSSVVISGWVDGPEVISRVIQMAEDYYPKVINNIRVGDNQQVQLHVQVMEVSRTKLRQLGVDWGFFATDGFVAQSVGGLIAETTQNAAAVAGTGASTMTFGIAGSDSSFFGVVDALRQHDLVKILAEPVLTTVSGRPAAFNAGGEFPILIPQGLGTVAIEYKTFGTRVDFVPIVLGNGNIRLEVRPQVSEIDASRGVDINGFTVPGLVNRWVDTAVEMRAGQTLALAGLIQDRIEAQNRGVPVLSDLPWAGALFRRVVQSQNEVELLVMVRPEFVDAMDPHEVPLFGPGEQTTIPTDKEMFCRGYLEVPACCPDGSCVKCRAGRGKYSANSISGSLHGQGHSGFGAPSPSIIGGGETIHGGEAMQGGFQMPNPSMGFESNGVPLPQPTPAAPMNFAPPQGGQATGLPAPNAGPLMRQSQQVRPNGTAARNVGGMPFGMRAPQQNRQPAQQQVVLQQSPVVMRPVVQQQPVMVLQQQPVMQARQPVTQAMQPTVRVQQNYVGPR